MTETFEMNGKTYRTDAETLAVLRSIVPSAHATTDASAVAAVMVLGIQNGRIVEVPKAPKFPEHKVTAKIGRSGTKNHPALAHRDARGRYFGLLFVCHCTGTGNGSAAQRASIVGEGWEHRTCGHAGGQAKVTT